MKLLVLSASCPQPIPSTFVAILMHDASCIVPLSMCMGGYTRLLRAEGFHQPRQLAHVNGCPAAIDHQDRRKWAVREILEKERQDVLQAVHCRLLVT